VCDCTGGHTFTNAYCSAIFGGCTNLIGAQAGCITAYATIGGGYSNWMCSLSQYSGQKHNFIGGGRDNRILSDCGTSFAGGIRAVCFSTIVGGDNNCISSYLSGGKSANSCAMFIGGGVNNLIERNTVQGAIFGGSGNQLPSSTSCAIIFGNVNLTGSFSSYSYADTLSKTSGKFSIRHPDPDKKHTHNLVHSFVEAPTAGENIYRYEVATQNCEALVSLPDYYKFLNCNDQVWITPKNHMGVAYGNVNTQQTEINIKSNCDGTYYVLLIGTRKDEFAMKSWRGVETERIICRSIKCN
jgi:hypothetical protein